MAAIHLADAVGGNVFLGFISAVAFATILAVVAGLTLSGASAVSHDLYATVFKKGKASSADELKVSRITTLALGVIAVVLGIAFEKQNIAFMVSLAFAIAASANFPVLFMSVLWKNCTTYGAAIGGFIGLATAVVLTILSKSVWVDVLHMADVPVFPYASPALFSMTAGFLGIWLFSTLDNSARARKTGQVTSPRRCVPRPASAQPAHRVTEQASARKAPPGLPDKTARGDTLGVAVFYWAVALIAGRSSNNTVPPDAPLSRTVIVPPCAVTISLAMDSPSPLPVPRAAGLR